MVKLPDPQRCKHCGETLVQMNFGFAGSDMECPNGPWGKQLHGDFDSFMFAIAPMVVVLCAGAFGLLMGIVVWAVRNG